MNIKNDNNVFMYNKSSLLKINDLFAVCEILKLNIFIRFQALITSVILGIVHYLMKSTSNINLLNNKIKCTNIKGDQIKM